jgi:ribosomal protein S14
VAQLALSAFCVSVLGDDSKSTPSSVHVPCMISISLLTSPRAASVQGCAVSSTPSIVGDHGRYLRFQRNMVSNNKRWKKYHAHRHSAKKKNPTRHKNQCRYHNYKSACVREFALLFRQIHHRYIVNSLTVCPADAHSTVLQGSS